MMDVFKIGQLVPASFIVLQQSALVGTDELKDFARQLPHVTGVVDVHTSGLRQVRIEIDDEEAYAEVSGAIEQQFNLPYAQRTMSHLSI